VTRVVVEHAGSPLGVELVARLASSGAQVEELREWGEQRQVDAYIHLGSWSDPPPVRPFVDLGDEDLAAAFDRPVLDLLWSLRAAFAHLRRPGARVVVVVPTIGMAGAPGLAALAAAAEAQRLLVKSIARQWGADGIVLNVVAADLSALAPGTADLPSVSLSPPALGASAVADLGGLARLVCSVAVGETVALTGVTLSADGGTWMGP
jgi:3-oxoacyl-[acyl-carrier protein] reductase